MVPRSAGREVMRAIRAALMQHWDPIGVADIPEAADEYDSYLGREAAAGFMTIRSQAPSAAFLRWVGWQIATCLR